MLNHYSCSTEASSFGPRWVFCAEIGVAVAKRSPMVGGGEGIMLFLAAALLASSASDRSISPQMRVATDRWSRCLNAKIERYALMDAEAEDLVDPLMRACLREQLLMEDVIAREHSARYLMTIRPTLLVSAQATMIAKIKKLRIRWEEEANRPGSAR